MKVNRDVGVTISLLFVRQFDIQAHGIPFGFGCAFVRRFHYPRSAPSDHGEMMFGKPARQSDGSRVIRVAPGGPSGTEDRDRRADL